MCVRPSDSPFTMLRHYNELIGTFGGIDGFVSSTTTTPTVVVVVEETNSCWLVRMMVMLIDWMGYNANSYDGGNDG